ncbi:hypothetical protein [Sphingomonas sanxanigenens]|uniref:DUF2946 domain-containing protein n=1 Tax=Sphingomonas sanxanigenens DSM 19645 = NX02 TaxID=1123269 RepID=W0AJA2_9SPHN|nr:hypothetical protein [Sphingomonas sanxanigenens]AHE56627.1 hypothetical protein NX02_25100 [Sphingomonas sanxanigenens DSM 19645 = NX02]
MRGLWLFRTTRGGTLALLLVACALLLRIAIPAGWMPSTGADGLIRITLCTGQGQMEAWVDGDGRIHDRKPGKSEPKTDHPCAFAGLIVPALDAAPIDTPLRFARGDGVVPAFAHEVVAIGHGLAAPPPPPTGPPAFL